MNGQCDADSSLQWLSTLVAFWSTVLLTRILGVWLPALGIIPGIFIRGRHVHHFVVGFALVLVAPLMRRCKRQTSWALLGVGLGLVTDEFLFWTMLEFDYWSLRNLLAVIATGTILAVVYQHHRTAEWVDLDDFGDLHARRSHENPEQPRVSVVVPAYNEEKNLPLALASLLNQELKDFELIVVDNGSTDETPVIAKKLGARVIGENRRGVAHARQAGFLSSKGGIIATTDADTVVPPDWLSRIVREFREDTNLVAVGGLYRFYSGPPLVRVLFSRVAYPLWRIDRSITGGWSLPGCNLAVTREAFLKVGGFNANLQLCEDADLVQRLRSVGNVKLRPDLVVATSGRRYRNGLMSGLSTYAPNLLLLYVLKKRKWNRLRTERRELPSPSSLAVRIAALTLLLVYVFSHGNVALARSRRSVVAGGKHAATRVVSMGHNSLAKHLRRRH
jgi:glycosyltransferase involved in cell wall biosynthesis